MTMVHIHTDLIEEHLLSRTSLSKSRKGSHIRIGHFREVAEACIVDVAVIHICEFSSFCAK